MGFRDEPGTLGRRVFGPIVCVSASDDAKAVCAKNNVSVAALFQPFGDVPVRAPLRDLNSQPYVLEELFVRFTDISQLERLSDKDFIAELARAISRAPVPAPKDVVCVRDRSDIENYLAHASVTPWFDDYRHAFFRLLRASTHDSFSVPVCCIGAVSTAHPDPLSAFATLYNPQYPPPPLSEPWVDPNILRAHFLLHDASHPIVTRQRAEEILDEMKRVFDPRSCFLLEINTRSSDTAERDFCPPDIFLETLWRAPATPGPTASMAGMGEDGVDGSVMARTPSPLPATNIPDTGSFLTVGDMEQVREVVYDFVRSCLLPYLSKTNKTLSDQLSHMRRGMARSFFSSTKKWFGAPSAGVYSEKVGLRSTGYGPNGYAHEGIEAQSRKLADYAFMLGDYDLAGQTYQAIRREYQHDKAWKYMAGAQEMAGLCLHYMEPHRREGDPYLEQANQAYLQRCNSSMLSERAGLLLADINIARGQHREAAAIYIRMTGEDSDLRSAVLLEQAAHCFLHLSPAMYRKYAFHLILAGHRYGKANLRRHGLVCYYQSLQVYKGRSWSLAEDHIYFTIGRQSFYLSDLAGALDSFAALLRYPKVPSSQESSYLKEFLYTLKQYLATEHSTGELAVLPVPTIEEDSLHVILFEQLQTQLPEKDWVHMEKTISERHFSELDKRRWDFPVFKSAPPVLTKDTDNSVSPIVTASERIVVEFELRNHLTIPVHMHDLALLCTFTPASDKKTDTSMPGYIVDTVEKVFVEGGEVQKVQLGITPQQEGELVVSGIQYSISNVVRGREDFKLRGKRLNSTKTQRMQPTYETDNRLRFKVVDPMPRLLVSCTTLPQTLLAGEVHEATLELHNVGLRGLSELCCITSHPNTMVLGLEKATMVGPDGSSKPWPRNVDGRDVVYSNAGADKGILNLIDKSEQLPPGHTLRMPLWYRSEKIGPQQLNILFGYKGEDAKRWRFARHALDTNVVASLRVSAYVQPSAVDVADLLLAVEFENLQGHVKFDVRQLSCVSAKYDVIPLFTPAVSANGLQLGPREVMTSYLKLVPRKPDALHPPKGISDAHPSLDLSDVLLLPEPIDCSAAPLSELFLKDKLCSDHSDELAKMRDDDLFPPSRMSSPTSSRSVSQPPSPPPSRTSTRSSAVDMKNMGTNIDPSLSSARDDVVSFIVLWGVQGQEQSGQHHIVNMKVGVPAMLRPIEARTVFTDSIVKFLLDHPDSVVHDFSKQKMCNLPVRLRLRNSSSLHACNVIVELLPPAPSQNNHYPNTVISTSRFIWVKQTRFVLPLAAEEESALELCASVLKSGVYDLMRLRVTASVDEEIVAVTQPSGQSLVTVEDLK